MEARGENLKQIDMGAPYKMKYTNGKKADTASFPFKKDDSPLDFSMENAGEGAVQGAKMGAALGPWGAVAGGVIGGVAAGYESKATMNQQDLDEKRADDEEQFKKDHPGEAMLGTDRVAGKPRGSYGSSGDPLNPDKQPAQA